jgi:hypothetical protein
MRTTGVKLKTSFSTWNDENQRLSDAVQTFRSSLETIERAYEFMLAYAAQGRATDEGHSVGPSIRETLGDLHAALGSIAAEAANAYGDNANSGFIDALGNDATRASHSVQLALSCKRLSSQLVDNLNASIHLRAVLTGLFLADEALNIATQHQD